MVWSGVPFFQWYSTILTKIKKIRLESEQMPCENVFKSILPAKHDYLSSPKQQKTSLLFIYFGVSEGYK